MIRMQVKLTLHDGDTSFGITVQAGLDDIVRAADVFSRDHLVQGWEQIQGEVLFRGELDPGGPAQHASGN